MLPSEIPRFPTDPLVIWCFGVSKHQCFLVFGNFSFKTPFLGMDPLPYLFCLSFYLLYFVLPPFKDNGWLSGCLMSSASIQKLFCGICSAFKCSFDEFVGEKVGLPDLFLCHLRTPPLNVFSYRIFFWIWYQCNCDLIEWDNEWYLLLWFLGRYGKWLTLILLYMNAKINQWHYLVYRFSLLGNLNYQFKLLTNYRSSQIFYSLLSLHRVCVLEN